MTTPSRARAAGLATDPGGTMGLLSIAVDKARQHRQALAKVWADLEVVLRFVGAWRAGTYRAVPWRTVIAAIGALIYFVDPLDVVPDYIIGVGYVDDAALIALVVRSIRRDLDRFLIWEHASVRRPPR